MATDAMAPVALGSSNQRSVSELSAKFDGLASRLRRVALLRGVGRLAVTLAALCAVGLLADWLVDLSGPMRMAWLAVVVGGIALTLWTAVIRPVFRRFSAAELAAIVEAQYPELGERLTSTIELTDPRIPNEEKGSALMREWLETETLSSVQTLDFRQAVSAERAKKSAWVGVVAVALLLVPFLVSSAYGPLWARLLSPWGQHEMPSELYFIVPDGDRVAARGEDLTLLAVPPEDVAFEDLPQAVELVWTNSQDETNRRAMEYDVQQKAFVVTLPHVFESFDYLVTAKRKRSERHTITVADRPEILTATLNATPPRYTGLPAKAIDGITGDLMVFERSRITVQLTFNKPISLADWAWLEPVTPIADEADQDAPPQTLPFQLAEDRQSATLEFTATTGGAFAIRLLDAHGLTNSPGPNRQLLLVPDQPPELTVSGQPGTTRARPNDVLSIEANALDDVGIAALELHVETAAGQTELIPVPMARLGGRDVRHPFSLDLAAYDLSDGQWLKYRVRAADDRPIPGPQEVWSDERRIILDSLADLPGSEQITQRQHDLRGVLEAIQKDLKQSKADLETLRQEAEERAADGNKNPFSKAEELAALTQQERELARRLEELAERFGEHKLFANLTPDTQRIAREQLAQAAEQLAQAAREEDLKDKAEALKKTEDTLAAAEKQLEDLARRFDELADLERDLLGIPRIAQQAERLAKRAAELARQRDNPPADETPEDRQARLKDIQREQAELNVERQQLADALDDLLNRRPEVLEAARKNALEQIAELSKLAGKLAETQDLLAEALKREAQEDAQAAAPIAEHQAELIEQAKDLERAAKPQEPAAKPPQVAPIDPEELRKVLEDLKAGNLDAAANRQEQLADRLEALAAELNKNKNLPSDPQQAAQELATRQRELQQKLQDAAAKKPGENATEEEQKAFEDSVRQLAEQQTGLQAGIAQLNAPKAQREQQQAALDQAAETVNNLIKKDADKAAQTAEQTAQALEELSQQIGSPEERQAKAKAAAEALRKKQEELSKQVAAVAEKEKADALEALQKAAETQEKIEELIKKEEQKPSADNNQKPQPEQPPKANDELERLIQEQAEAQKKAAQALERLEQKPADKDTQNPQETLDEEMNKPNQPTQPRLPPAEDVEQLAREARGVQQEIQQLQQDRAEKNGEQVAQAEQPAESSTNNQNPNGQSANGSDPKNQTTKNQSANVQPANGSDPKGSPTKNQPTNSQPANGSDPKGSDPKQSPAPGEGNKSESEQGPRQPNGSSAEKTQGPPTEPEMKTGQRAEDQPPKDAAQQAQPAEGEKSLTTRQAELARKAAELALEVARDQGAEADASQRTAEAARNAEAAHQQAAGGLLDEAAKSAKASAQDAGKAAQSLAENQPKDAPAKLAERARQQAQAQTQLAEAFEEAASSPAARRAAQQAGQQELAEASKELANQLDEAAEKLSSQPLSLKKPGEETQQAGQAAEEATKAMNQAEKNLGQGNAGQAAEEAARAADALKRAAGQTPAPPEDTPENSIVPGDLAEQVAEASRQLEEARRQLGNAQAETQALAEAPPAPEADPDSPMPADAKPETEPAAPQDSADNADGKSPPGEDPGQTNSENQPPGTPQPGQGQSPKPGQAGQQPSALSQSAQSLQRAAQSLNQAAQQLQGGQASKQSSAASQAQSQGTGQPQAGGEGTGSASPVPLEELEAELKAQSRQEWGQLPGQLRTEILQGSKQQPGGDYARLIKLYSEELLKKQQATPPKK